MTIRRTFLRAIDEVSDLIFDALLGTRITPSAYLNTLKSSKAPTPKNQRPRAFEGSFNRAYFGLTVNLMLLVADKKSELLGNMVTEIVIEPSDVGRYLHVAVFVSALATVLIAVHPEIALLLARNVTLDGVFTCAAIGLVCRNVTLMG